MTRWERLTKFEILWFTVDDPKELQRLRRAAHAFASRREWRIVTMTTPDNRFAVCRVESAHLLPTKTEAKQQHAARLERIRLRRQAKVDRKYGNNNRHRPNSEPDGGP
jgi:hypothetical protein